MIISVDGVPRQIPYYYPMFIGDLFDFLPNSHLLITNFYINGTRVARNAIWTTLLYPLSIVEVRRSTLMEVLIAQSHWICAMIFLFLRSHPVVSTHHQSTSLRMHSLGSSSLKPVGWVILWYLISSSTPYLLAETCTIPHKECNPKAQTTVWVTFLL